MISETKFRVETPYGVKIFQIFYFQNSLPLILKKLAKKKFSYLNVSIFCLVAHHTWMVRSFYNAYGMKDMREILLNHMLLEFADQITTKTSDWAEHSAICGILMAQHNNMLNTFFYRIFTESADPHHQCACAKVY